MINYKMIDIMIAKDIKGNLDYSEVKAFVDLLGLSLGNHGDDYMCDCSNAEAFECWHFGDDTEKSCIVDVEFDFNYSDNGDRTPGAVHHINIDEYMLVSRGFLKKRQDGESYANFLDPKETFIPEVSVSDLLNTAPRPVQKIVYDESEEYPY